MKKTSDIKLLKWIYKVMGKDRKYVFLLILIRSLQGIEGTSFALQLKYVVNAATAHDKSLLIKEGLKLGVILVYALILYILAIYIKEKGNAVLEKRFRGYAFESLINKQYGFISAKHSGEWMVRIGSDTQNIYSTLLETLPMFCETIVQLASSGIAIITLFSKASVLMILCGAAFVLFSMALRKKLREYQLDVQTKDAAYRSYVQEHINNMIIIRSFNKEKQIANAADEHGKTLVKSKMARTRFTTICSTLMYASIRVAYFGGVCLCGYLLYKQRMDLGDMTSGLQLVSLLVTPISQISTYIPKFFAALVSAERLVEIDEGEKDHEEDVYSDETIHQYYQDKFNSIVLDDITFSYSENDYESAVIRDFNLEIEKGDYIAFTGMSGCGKSTIIKLIMCLYPILGGRRFLKNKDGSEEELTSNWRNLFSYVPQGNYLVSGTIREVIAFNEQSIMDDEEALWHALEISCAKDFISKLPDGLDTVLSENGAGISEGQMQRIAIARAILTRRPILLLDEATSSLDEVTEKNVVENLKNMTDYTVILITHRPAALSICNKRVDF